jgi:predicted nucleic acid-binding protein
MIVADTNLIAYLHLESPFTQLADKVLRRAPQWIAPSLWKSEFRNVLVGTMREQNLHVDDAIRLAGEAEELVMEPNRRITNSEVMHLAESSGCSAYDCEFVALAISLNTRLVTNDREVLEAFPAVAVSLGEFADGR